MTETAQTIKDSIEIVAPYIQQVAEKIGESGMYLFSLGVKQQYVLGIDCLLSALFPATVLFIMYKIFNIIRIKYWDKCYGEDKRAIAVTEVLVFILVALPLLHSMISDIREALPHFVNPEYLAIMDIIAKFK